MEYYDFDEPPFLAQKSEEVYLQIGFTIYYDRKNKDADHETIIESVEQIMDDSEES